jgi:hypothetical protein
MGMHLKKQKACIEKWSAGDKVHIGLVFSLQCIAAFILDRFLHEAFPFRIPHHPRLALSRPALGPR